LAKTYGEEAATADAVAKVIHHVRMYIHKNAKKEENEVDFIGN
jgi:hypothetical protein